MRSGCWGVLSLLLLLAGTAAFKITRGPSVNHLEISERAILDVTVQTCRTMAEQEGRDFVPPPRPLTASGVIRACDAAESSKSFLRAIKVIQTNNKRVDISRLFNPNFHFDDEKFDKGRDIITDGLRIIKDSNKLGNFEAAREKLGEITHPLQDFYSHSNWVELGHVIPNNNLITVGTTIGNINLTRPTCRSCVGNDCTNNILEDIIRDQILTTGYFGAIKSSKPAGKCSHGGGFDQTSDREPTGGINKDILTAEHGNLHNVAARLAEAATVQLLDDIRGAAGDTDFLRMVGITKGSNKALCFVIDTTESMSDEINALKAVTASLVDSKVGTRDEPSLYILVPFNDPEFGPLMRTTDPNVFKTWINSTKVSGGGDFPEMSLSGLQLALAGAPPGSEIFLFTDAAAKDIHLEGAVIALIERTKTVVNFLITGSSTISFRSVREMNSNNQTSQISESDSQLYSALAHASGGQAIQVSKGRLSEATTIITESSAASLVTILQATRGPENNESFSFSVDESLRNLTIYITGSVLNFTLTSPSGVSQNINSSNDSLAAMKVVGNFRTLQINPTATGVWEIMILSMVPYSIKIIGQSGIDFLFDFVQFFQGASEGFDVLENRPVAGGNATLLLTLTGLDSSTLTNVSLVEASGALGELSGKLEALGGGDFLARFDTIPSVDFVVRLKGRADGTSRASTNDFQRQSPGSLRASALTVTTTFDGRLLEPGSSFSVPFTVTTNGTGGNFTIQATNDQGLNSTFPSQLELASGGSANGRVNLTSRLDTPTGTAVTLTIQAQSPGGNDTNYVVLRLSIVSRATDNSKPVCRVMSVEDNCTPNCSQFTWEVRANLTDDNSTGIDRIALQKGNGTLNTSTMLGPDGENVTLVVYNASCCSPDFKLVAVDGAGNVGFCSETIRNAASTTAGPPVTTTTTTSSIDTSTTTSLATNLRMSSSCYFWQTILVMLGFMVMAQC